MTNHLEQAGHAENAGLAEPASATPDAAPDQVARLELQTERLRGAFVVRVASAESENIYLIVASVICTLAGKFGDAAAAWLNF